MRTSALFGAKTLDFTKYMVCPHRQKGIEPCSADLLWIRGSVFRDFVRTSFMDDPQIIVTRWFYGELQPGIWKRKLEAVNFLWKRKHFEERSGSVFHKAWGRDVKAEARSESGGRS